ncbi:c-type cytochrome [Spirosoma endbachense]|uniref:C-type cytochrome n=1 Tax=Spirosoma endbachense TaxID=2666025 RepID=A0A6P1VZJ8_9BACT|nr:cytochrome c [Spirosoma endbachense]QHV97512.1 c-type cytochrome [Spirosoma endbachense]
MKTAKKIFKRIGQGFGLVLLLVAGFCAYVAITPPRTYDPPVAPTIQVESTEARIQRGEVIAHLQCISCHADNNNRLTGKRLDELPAIFGKVYSRNITKDKEKGIGNWTDGQLIYFLRTGIRPNGTTAFMPQYNLMADEDMKSVVAWLRSDRFPVQASKTEAPPAEYSFVAKMLAWTILQPGDFPNHSIPMPDSTKPVAVGRYVATAVADCYGCHSADYLDLDKVHPERTKGYFAGGSKFTDEAGKTIFSANLTFDEQTGIGKKYTKEQFIRAVKTGVRPDGSVFRYPMVPRPSLSDREIAAIYDYLKTIPRLNNNIAQKQAEVQLAEK